jgi:peroxiredoxin
VLRPPLGPIRSCLVAGALALLACGGSDADVKPKPAAAEASRATQSSTSAPAAAKTGASARPSSERPLPEIAGVTLDGKRIALSQHLGRRLLVFFFNPEIASARAPAEALRAVSAQRGDHNFEILGVAVGTNTATARNFVQEQQLDFDVIDDSNGAITRQLGLRDPVLILGADGEGYLKFGYSSLPNDARVVTQLLEDVLRLGPGGAARAQDARETAPDFSLELLDQTQRFQLASLRGKPAVVIFFLHTCPHCHHALVALKQLFAALPEAQRPSLVGIEVSGRRAETREELKKQGLDFFPVGFDDDGKIRDAYGVHAGVPDIFLVDRAGKITARMQGWNDERDPALLEMRVAKVGGAAVPMRLRQTGYSGNETCGVCHEAEYATWELTAHAGAFDTLVKHAADSNGECVSCHVVGFGQPGGYDSAKPDRELEGVGCESCHGRGGPHLSPGFVTGGDYATACQSCHDAKHSLGFDYATFSPRISHAANRPLLALPAAEKAKLLAERGRPKGLDALVTNATFVGSEACKSCHASEFETWTKHPHSHAVATLEAKGEANNPECLRCHTTGMGRPGGFRDAGAVASASDLARVGCEACHGPGSAHVAEGASPRGTILGLADKCDSCVILQICGGCHDDANDKGFPFEVEKKIEHQRHGTPAARANSAARSASVDAHTLAALAFHERDARAWTGR